MANTHSIILLAFLFFQMASLQPVHAQAEGPFVQYYTTRKMGMSAYGSVYCPSTGAGASDIEMSLMCSIEGDDGFSSFGRNTTNSNGFFNITRALSDLDWSDYTAACYVEYYLPTTRGNCLDFYTAKRTDVWSYFQYQGTMLTATWGWVEKQFAQNWQRYVYNAADNPVYYPEPPVPSEYIRPVPPVATYPTMSPSPMQDTPNVIPSPVQEPIEPPQVNQGLPQAPDNSPQVSSSPSQADVDSPELSPSPMHAPVESQDNYNYYSTRKMGISAVGNVLCPTGGHGVPDIEMSLMCYISGDNFYEYGKSTTDSNGQFNVTVSLYDLRDTDSTVPCFIEYHLPTTRGNCVEFHTARDDIILAYLFDDLGTFQTANWGWVERKIAQNWRVSGPPPLPPGPSNLSPSPTQTPAESPEMSTISPTQDSVEYPPVSSSPSQSTVESPEVSPSPMQAPIQSPEVSGRVPNPEESPSPMQTPVMSPVASSSPTPGPVETPKESSNQAGISAYGNVYCSSTGNKPGKRVPSIDVNLRCSNNTDFVTIGHTTTNSAGFFNITLPGSDLTAFSPKPKCYVYFDVPTKAGTCAKFHTAAKSLIRSDIQAVRYEQTAAYGLVLREKAKRYYIYK